MPFGAASERKRVIKTSGEFQADGCASGRLCSAAHFGGVAHLAAGAGLALAVDVDVGAALGDQLGPALDLVADQIVHLGVAARLAR